MEFIIFILFPFLLLVALPAWVVPMIAMKFARISRPKDSPVLLVFPVCVLLFVIIANLFWNTLVFNHIYYEWDRTILPFSLITHESPILDGSGSWIAKGWTLWGLNLLWFGILIMIYLASVLVSKALIARNSTAQDNKILKLTLLILLGLSFLGLFLNVPLSGK